ncbi:MAG: mechanosensitive ion channel family protein [Chloroflexi bacterium]|nr:mechanosensitive ion channel family protein [Chloroflexota bacterium]
MDAVLANLLDILSNWLLDVQANLPAILAGLLVLLLAAYLSRLLANLLARSLRARRTDPEFVALLARLLRGAVLALGIVLALEQAGADVSALLTGLGILGFTLGFALQDISKNFVAGLLILLNQPFDLGDTVEVNGFTGKVMDINLRDLRLESVDGRYVRIPNGDVMTSSLINYSRTTRRRIELRVGVAYNTDLEKARNTALQAARLVPGLLDEPAPDFVFDTFGASAIEGALYYWIDMAQTGYWNAQTAGLGEVKRAFEAAGIRMPYPTRVLVMPEDREAGQLSGAGD